MTVVALATRRRFACLDCGVDTGRIGEHYVLSDEVWFQAHSSRVGMLCVGCIELRLGRSLSADDFVTCYPNEQRFASRSLRLTERMAA